MAQARREPRFSEIEVLPPAKARRPAAFGGAAERDLSDAVFETLPAQAPGETARRPVQIAQREAELPGLKLLKQNAGAPGAAGNAEPAITPGFAAFTILSALAVFWLCGGHALLY